MSQQDLFDYVMNTPHNTNPAILKQKIKGISGVTSWNDLTDKPFGVEQAFEPIVWDVSKEYEIFDASQFGIGIDICYKISDHAVTQEELAMMGSDLDRGYLCYLKNINTPNSWHACLIRDNGDGYPLEGWLDDGAIYYQVLAGVWETGYIGQLLFVYAQKDGYPSIGTYLYLDKNAAHIEDMLEFRITPPEITKPIDEKYLPESVDSVVIRSSTEGSGKKFKLTVDDSGSISATEVT